MAFLTCEIYSQNLRMDTTLSAIMPQDHLQNDRLPAVLYLLHGSPHNALSWQRYTSLERYAKQYNLAIFMPEANHSFYVDMKYGQYYHSYITEELPRLCESMFCISTDRKHRYIAGMSMGGYGALKAALSHPNFYYGCFAMSAVTDIHLKIRQTPDTQQKAREFCAIFGPDKIPSKKDDLFYLSSLLKNEKASDELPFIHLYCGSQDSLNPHTQALYEHLTALSWNVKKEEWNGVHDWAFWDQSIQRILSEVGKTLP